MVLFRTADRPFARTVAELALCNPFTPERIAHERAALGDDFVEAGAVWNVDPAVEGDHPNVARLLERAEDVLERARAGLAGGARGNAAEALLYEDLALFLLYYRSRAGFDPWLAAAPGRADVEAAFERFTTLARRYLALEGVRTPDEDELAHLFACSFQVRRAFHNVFRFLVGASRPAVALRAGVWQSIFTHDVRRYRHGLFRRMADYTTLVLGPTGTGKELVARAVGHSRYVPFDPRARRFGADPPTAPGTGDDAFHALNLSALSPTLIESELFGHRRGAFTGAVEDKAGWLEACGDLGTVFLDEIGDLDASIQVKLLRVLETRAFSRLGETSERSFRGKIIAATHQDLAGAMRAGRFREDFYYRLCSDVLVTPSLRERLQDDPGELRRLIDHLTAHLVGEAAPEVADEVEAWVGRELGSDYAWPGNVRELEQCVCNVLIRREYRPAASAWPAGELAWLDQARAGSLTAEELLTRYCMHVRARSPSDVEAARRLALDRRTVRARVERGRGYHPTP